MPVADVPVVVSSDGDSVGLVPFFDRPVVLSSRPAPRVARGDVVALGEAATLALGDAAGERVVAGVAVAAEEAP